MEDRLAPALVTWDGTGDGIYWDDPDNWDTDSLPTTSDDVAITTPASVSLMGKAIIRSLQCSADLAVSGTLALEAAGLPTKIPASMDHEGLISLMQMDKKSRDRRLMFALPREPGEMAGADRGFAVPATAAQVAEALARST